MSTIKCRVVADRVWFSKESRYAMAGEVIELPAEVTNHEGKRVPFNVGGPLELVKEPDPKAKGKGRADDLV